MATISNTISLNDAMSPALNSIASALAGVTAAFQQIQAASGQAINTQNIHEANNALQQTEAAQNNLNESLQQGSSTAENLWGKIKGLIAAYAGWQVVSQTVAWSDNMTNIQARLANINDGTRTQKELMQAVYEGSQRSRASLQGMADIVGRFGNNAKDAFKNNDELLMFAEQLNKQFSIAGTDANGAAAAMLQLSQGLGAGALRGEELNSVFEQAPIIIQTIADYMDVPVGQIRKLASEGQLTSDIVKNAMLGAAEETNKKFNEMPLTFSAAWTMAKNTFQMNALQLQKVLSDTFNSGEFQALMNSLTNAISSLIPIAIAGVKGFVAVVKALYENWSLIAPVIGIVVGALLTYKAVMIGINAVEMVQKGLKLASIVASYAMAAARGTEVAATTAATAAQWGLNTAMLASPVTWIIAAIIAIIGLLYLAVAVINKVTGESYSATGIIAGAIYGLYAFIKNVIGTIWNYILAFAEFFINVWSNPFYSIKKLIYNLAEVFANFFESVIKGIDPVATALAKGILWAVNKGIQAINWLSEAMDTIGLGWGQVGEIKMEGTVAENFSAAKKSMLSAIDPGEAPEGYVSLDKYRMDMEDIGEMAAQGYAAGAKFADDPMGSISGALGLSDDPAIQELLDGQQKQIAATESVADNTDQEQDYRYLKEIMGGRAVDRLSGTDIKIDMTNNNRINSALDLDVIVNELTKKLTGAMDSAGEGVHV